MMHLQMPPPRPSQSAPVTPALDAVVLKAMEKGAERRFQSAGAFLAALRAAVEGDRATNHASGEALRAVAIYVEAQVSEPYREDDESFEEPPACIETAEQTLRAAGFSLPLQTGATVLAIRLLSASQDKDSRKSAIDLAKQLAIDLAVKHPKLDLKICVHAGDAHVHQNADGIELVGGPLALISQWVPMEVSTPVVVTPEAAADLR
jgi:eukaryotic-like serine/threonine-protein kinase